MFSDYPLWVTTTIYIHVAASLIAMAIGVVAMRSRRGGTNHARSGKAFFWSMMTVCATGTALQFFNFNIFLGVITILSFYTSLTGYRAPSRRTGQFTTWIDWAAAGVAVLGGLTLIGVAIGLFTGFISSGASVSLGGLCLGFGILVGSLGWSDIRQFRTPPTDKNWWLFLHVDRMLSSYMALMVAFSVQVVTRRVPLEMQWIAWVTPVVIGTVWINVYLKRLRKKVEQGITVAA